MTQKRSVRVGLVGEQWQLDCRDCGETFKAFWSRDVFAELAAHLAKHRNDPQAVLDDIAAFVDERVKDELVSQRLSLRYSPADRVVYHATRGEMADEIAAFIAARTNQT